MYWLQHITLSNELHKDWNRLSLHTYTFMSSCLPLGWKRYPAGRERIPSFSRRDASEPRALITVRPSYCIRSRITCGARGMNPRYLLLCTYCALLIKSLVKTSDPTSRPTNEFSSSMITAVYCCFFLPSRARTSLDLWEKQFHDNKLNFIAKKECSTLPLSNFLHHIGNWLHQLSLNLHTTYLLVLLSPGELPPQVYLTALQRAGY